MRVYTKEDELPEDIAEHGDDRVDVETLPEEHKEELEHWGYDVDDVIVRETDGAA